MPNTNNKGKIILPPINLCNTSTRGVKSEKITPETTGNLTRTGSFIEAENMAKLFGGDSETIYRTYQKRTKEGGVKKQQESVELSEEELEKQEENLRKLSKDLKAQSEEAKKERQELTSTVGRYLKLDASLPPLNASTNKKNNIFIVGNCCFGGN